MSNFSDQLGEIKASISSSTKKSLAYATLLYLQEQSTTNGSASIQALAETTPSLIPLMVSDIHDQDEEIAGQALKCLGFIMYHPSLSASISVEGVSLILESLVKLITTTKMKSVCNLGVWCISIQQINEAVLVSHFDSLLQAVVHGLENPMGSLSTTFEAIQAVMKLAVQLAEKMRGLSHVWAPSIYRRLLSSDKRERDMSERCLLKIKSLVLPPSLNLSKVLVKDIKQTLLTRMKDLLNHGSKVQIIRAWGWFVQLLGSYALKNKNLINDMLKIPQHTFSDHDPQVQIASQVAWEGLIDALIHPALLPYMRNDAKDNKSFQEMGTFKMENNEIHVDGLSKSLKLIMTPLIGIMSSKSDASVYTSCFKTWCYLLHKLGSSVNCLSVKKLVLQPVCEAVFQIGPDCKSLWVWNLCIDLVDDLILAKCKDAANESPDLANHHLSDTTSIHGPLSGKCPWKQYPITWLPWELSQLDFHLKIIYSLISQASRINPHEKKSLAYDASLRLFRSVLKGVQMELRKASNTYDDILLCLNRILRFIKCLCEENSEGSDQNDLHNISLQLIEVVVEEIEPAMLGSPLYKVALDLKYIESQSIVDKTRDAKVSGMCSVTYMDMVSPVVYLTVLYFCVMAQSKLNSSSADIIFQAIRKYFKIIFSSCEPQENFVITVGLLYKHGGPSCLRMWTAIAEGLNDYIRDMKNISLFKLEHNNAYFATCDLLCYPFIICYCPRKDYVSAKISGSMEESHVSPQRKIKLEQVIEVWNSLFCSLCTSELECFTANKFPEDLCNTLAGWLDKHTSMIESTNELESSHRDLDLDQSSFYVGVMTCILASFRSSEFSPDKNNGCSRDHKISSGINSCLTLAIRFMRFLHTKIGKAPDTALVIASRLYPALAHFISCLHLKQDILSFVQVISSPLLQWLTQLEMEDESTNDFQLIWLETLNCLRRSQPPLIFDSAFLKLQSPLLEKTLDHPTPSISEPTICFWNSTYGDQIKLDYPQNLLHALDKLSRNGRINLHKKSPPFLERCDSRVRVDTAPEKCSVNATHNRYSKRVELVKGNLDHTNKQKDMPCLNLKRKRLELTEHQKEVRRAQQGREMDCGGHGLGGIRTYTNLDFSQGNEDSQESQEIWNLESILDISKKA